MSIVKLNEPPDTYCMTTPDGDCVSTDPRCIHRRGTHLSHCYQDEYETTCKYGDKECPARKVTRKVERPRHPLDTLSVHDLSALRRIIEEVIEQGDRDGYWKLHLGQQDSPLSVKQSDLDAVRKRFLDAIEQRIIAAATPGVGGGQ